MTLHRDTSSQKSSHQKRPLFVLTYAMAQYHFETDLELIQTAIAEGEKPVILICNGQINGCDFNSDHLLPDCLYCMGRRRSGLGALSEGVLEKQLVKLSATDIEKVQQFSPVFSNVEELKAIRFDAFEIGYGVASTVVSLAVDPEPDMERWGQTCHKLLRSSLITYLSLRQHLAEGLYSKVVVYNGRFALSKAVIQAAEAESVDFVLHERGCSVEKYDTWKNSTPHGLTETVNRIDKIWDAEPDFAKKEKIAVQFFEDQRERNCRAYIHMGHAQKEGSLPAGFDRQKRNVGVFLSSQEEFTAISAEWANRLYGTQANGLSQVLQSFSGESEFHFYVRFHPKMINERGEHRVLRKFLSDNVTAIFSDEEVDTYALMEACEKIISFGSTTGLESAFWGKPSILLGPCYWTHWDICYVPQNHEETVALIQDSLAPKDKRNAYRYPYFKSIHGIAYRYFKPTSFFSGEFNGRTIRPKGLMKVSLWVQDRLPALINRWMRRLWNRFQLHSAAFSSSLDRY